MYLKSLTIRGFKSFAERTVLRFEKGVTSIVGPNGSGKSNISEAVMWVLGEQSARSLRSGSMEDVIFAGSSARPALGMAEVSLTLSNTDGSLPIEFSEVTITRRLYRSGESDYFINNSPCRLLDIHELLADTGLGKGLYSIIGQGRLEEILNSKPEEKRLLIEEAAGIIKHKKRKDRALRKLDSMDQNLQRAKDIAQEISRQLKPLKNQANKTQEFHDLNSQLRSLEIGLAIIDLQDLQQQWEDILALEADLQEQHDSLREDLSQLHAQAEKLQLEFETKNFYSGDISEKRRRLQSVEEKLYSSISLLAEKEKNIEQRIGEVKHKLSHTEQHKNHLLDQTHWLEREKLNLINETNKNTDSLDTLERQLKDYIDKREESENTVSELKNKVVQQAKTLETSQADAATLQLAIQTAENQLTFLQAELKQITKRKNDLYVLVDQKKRDLELVSIELARVEFRVNELDVEINNLGIELDLKRAQETELRQEYASIAGRVRALEDVIDSFPTTSDITESFDTIEMIGVLGLVKDAIQVRPEYERAIEAVLGGDIFCIVLENSEVLKVLLEKKGSESFNLTSFIVNEQARFQLPTSKLPKATWALDVVSYPDSYKFAISALLSHVYIVKDFAAALSMQEKVKNEILVTRDGEVLLPNGKIIFGAASEAIGILGYHRELQELNGHIVAIELSLKDLEKEQQETETRLIDFEDQKRTAVAKLQAKKVEQSNLRQSLQDMEPEHSSTASQEEVLHSRVLKLDTSLAEDKASLEQVRQDLRIQKEKLYTLQFNLDETASARDAFFEEETKLRLDTTGIRADINVQQNKIANNDKRIQSILKELDSFEGQNESDKQFLQLLEEIHEKIAPLRESYRHLLEGVLFRHEQITQMTSFEEGTLEDLRQDLRQATIEINRTSNRIDTLVRQLHESEVKKAQLELKVTSAVQKVVDEYDVPLEKALDQGLTIPAADAQAEVSALKRRIVQLGPINPIAVEEYRQLEERHQLFSNQIQDLLRGRKSLMKVVSAIELKMKESFVETFEQVNVNFQRIFESLFPGGQAELILTEPDDITNSGVDIVAQPGGKRLQRLSLLSGGEKSLVALAFSFALYQTRPSPFYILDEVEAALDDINLQRFIAMLNRVKQKSQVLIITHQRRTMEIADTLYGVSMQADGVSRLISQKFSEVTLV